VVRDRASLARIVDDGKIENVYRLQVMNTTEQVQTYRFSVSGLPGLGIEGQPSVQLGPAEAKWVPINVQLPPEAAQSNPPGAHTIHFEIRSSGTDQVTGATVSEKSTFMIPR
jgi:polyferredoxin